MVALACVIVRSATAYSYANAPPLDDGAFGILFRRCTKREPKERPKMRDCALWIKGAVEGGKIAGVDRRAFAEYVNDMDAGRVSDEPLMVEDLVRLAQSGSGMCNYVLGQVYSKGIGVPQDLATAGRYLRVAAEKKHIGALERLRLLAEENAIEATAQEVTSWQDEFTLLTRNRGHLNVSQSARLSCLASSGLGQWSNFGAE
jgi:TPR repeat protein